jgi:hypothetical protein
MCAPPGQWQTYDITFKASRFAPNSRKRLQEARITVLHNGVKIHDNVALRGATGGSVNRDERLPGGIMLQDHGNPVQFRNIWVVEMKDEGAGPSGDPLDSLEKDLE